MGSVPGQGCCLTNVAPRRTLARSATPCCSRALTLITRCPRMFLVTGIFETALPRMAAISISASTFPLLLTGLGPLPPRPLLDEVSVAGEHRPGVDLGDGRQHLGIRRGLGIPVDNAFQAVDEQRVALRAQALRGGMDVVEAAHRGGNGPALAE